MFDSIINTSETAITSGSSLICMGVALAIGLVIACCYMFTQKKGTYSKDLVIAIAILPAIVAVVITLINDNIARAFSLGGAFALVRFRSAPGSAKDITVVFLTMSIGLACGLGYVGFAAVVALIVLVMLIVLSVTSFGEPKMMDKVMKITIPEDLNYKGVFEPIFEKYVDAYELVKVKTSNMGTLYELTYELSLKSDINEKELMDDIRTRNGNLNISLGIKPYSVSGQTL